MDCGESFNSTVEADPNFVIEDDVGANVILYSSQRPSKPTSTSLKVPSTGKVLTFPKVSMPGKVLKLTKVSAPGKVLTLSKVPVSYLPPGKELTPVKVLASGKALASGKVLTIGEALTTGKVLTSSEILTSGKVLTTGKVLMPVKVLNSAKVIVNTSKPAHSPVQVVKVEPPDQIFYETASAIMEDEDVAMNSENFAMEDEYVGMEDEIVASEEIVKTEVVSELQDASDEDAVQYELVFDNDDGVTVRAQTEHDYAPPAPPAQPEFFCGVCGKSFPAERRVRQHMSLVHFPRQGTGKRKASAGKNIVCEQCGKKYPSNAQLRYHQRTHTGEKPYQCTMCPKAFTMPFFLQIHIRTHTGERPYPCSVCVKAFNNPAALWRHKRVHTGEKPYTCDTCGKSFTQSNSLKLHIRTVHLKLPAPYVSKERRLRQLMKKQMEAQGDTSTRTQATKPKTKSRRMRESMNFVNDGESLEDNFVLTY